MRKTGVVVLCLVLLVGVGLAGFAQSATKSNIVIGFSNSYNGNTFRQEEEAFFKTVADGLKQSGVIKDYILTESNNNNSTQVSQVQNMILQKVSAILLDPGSPTALNGAIRNAKAAGIPVIIFNDGPVTSTECYQLIVDCVYNFGLPAQYICDRLHGKGNVLVIRGIPGVEYDILAYKGMMDVFGKYPGIKIVGSVYGQWTTSIAQSEVASILPSLPHVDAVCGQGGDEYGTVQAFLAAGREVPLITGGNRGNFLNWWAQEYKKNGYTTMSCIATPWFSVASLWLALDILDGKMVPQYMVYPMDVIYQADLNKYAGIADTAVAAEMHDHQWVIDKLESQKGVELSKFISQ